MTPSVIEVSNLRKTYRLGKVDVPVLRGVSLSVREGEFVAVLGASGSGKSTLLHLCGGLDRPDAARNGIEGGTVRFRGTDINRFSAADRNTYRNLSVGFVFQFYHLLPEMNVLENTMVAAMVRYGRFGFASRRKTLTESATKVLISFGLRDRLGHKPSELSGGERQRVAIARALMNEPTLLLADEPTGNLDEKTGTQIMDVIAGLHDRGQSIVMVTHDRTNAQRADRVVQLVNGQFEGSA